MKKLFTFFTFLLSVLVILPLFATDNSQQNKKPARGGGGGGPTISPDYGDLVIILRDMDGVPILSEIGCTQPLDINGELLPLNEECEILEGFFPVEVDFGRLSIARSPDYVIENRFDEMILAIKASIGVSVGPAGRLVLANEILNPETNIIEIVFKTIDSPLENLALYVHLMKVGHIQTDPEVSSGGHGDDITNRPALDIADYAKFSQELQFILPATPGSFEIGTVTNNDLLFSSFFLAAAGDKTGTITVDLVQNINDILKIPAWNNNMPENPDFVDFRDFLYERTFYFNNKQVAILQSGSLEGCWQETTANLLDWLSYINGETEAEGNIAGFVRSSNDGLKVIVLIHNYSIPEDIWF